MAKKSYGISNVSYRDDERIDDFLLVRENGKENFVVPRNINSYGYMFPSPEIDQYPTGRDTDNVYTRREMDNIIQDMTIDVTTFISSLTGALNSTIEENKRNGLTLITSDNIVEVD